MDTVWKLTLGRSLRILAGPFPRPVHVVVSGLDSGRHGAAHEAPFPTEQPPSQEDPRLPCAHGDQGRTTRAQPPPRQGPQASCRLTTGPSRPGKPPAAFSLPRGRRLTDKPQFDAVHRAGIRASDPFFMVIARLNGLGHPRLGLAVGIRSAGNAVNRNRIKRVARELFRRRQQELPAVDMVVNARAAAGKATNAQIDASLAALWARISERCARS
jgi:ribonuclease P protein component